jgi:hypothetical protein
MAKVALGRAFVAPQTGGEVEAAKALCERPFLVAAPL